LIYIKKKRFVAFGGTLEDLDLGFMFLPLGCYPLKVLDVTHELGFVILEAFMRIMAHVGMV
jgi:hypothetical protein